MLVLIAGVTGNLGQKLVKSLLSRNHQVRGLGRSPSKLDKDIQSGLESFVQSQNYYDVPALEKACTGVDAVICAYLGTPELQLEGQLLLLRAAERVGVKRYVAAAWNYDWRKMSFGQHESYDMYLPFRRIVEFTSEIRPIYIFTGVLAEVLFSVPGHGDFGPKNHGVWDPVKKEMHVWGEGNEVWHWTTEEDCAEFTAAILERTDAEDQQFWTVCSGESTLPEMAETYGKVRGSGGSVVKKGNLDDLRREAFDARRSGTTKRFYEYIGWFYQLFTVDGTWVLKDLDNDKLRVKATSLEQFFKDSPEI
ncbi:hypothetical protein M409DRAFT_64988 [Zasmidium cellare ATCC 36951]|uniref:NmrA-like domain-containing protein n=1 Tax=Zasmidium cellare ATCC 36951 TaxID=1080233 RepID=A0A6A6CU01_ZASCE|nr:uncharacterized protein M409DRAFT_64988 [Zasmidium cellare ATCC 36951]KAF2169269.1 hypothetical protein M409DRAFT_64988 [Zasmidium cellare ATCC 36951]